jgi:transposase-like protein
VTQRKRHVGAFKTRVVVQAIEGHKTVNEIASAYEIHPSQVGKWKSQALARLPEVLPFMLADLMLLEISQMTRESLS